MALRNRVAAAILHALEAGAAAGLDELVATCAPSPEERERVRDRLARGLEVAEACRRATPEAAAPLERALVRAVLLYRAELFFEVHEVLEEVWHDLEGARRTFVQGLIQVAVGLHHLAHDNPTGARSLFRSGRSKLAASGPRPEGVDVARLLAGLEPWEAAAAAGRWPTAAVLPPFVLATSDGQDVGGAPESG